MIFKPWDCAQPDEWLPRSLRLCWGGDGGGGFGGDSGGGGFTGGGDWGSSGSFDASGFNAGGDLGAWAGTAYDASTFGSGAGAGGDWGSFGPTSYASYNAPNPTFADIAGPNPGVTTGGGDWGSAGIYSAEGMGGGLGGSLYGGGDSISGPGGGLFGDYGGGGGGGYTGGGGGYVGGGGPFGGGGGGGRGAASPSVTSPSVTSPYADDTGPSGRGVSEVSSPYADDTGPTGRGEPDTVGPAPEAAPEAPSDFGKPSEAPPDAEAPPSDAAPSRSEDAPSRSDDAPSRTGSDEAPSTFGPESITSQEGRQALSDLTQAALAPQQDTYEGSPYADMGPQDQQSDPYAGPFAGPDVVGGGRLAPGEYGGRGYDLPGVQTIADYVTGLMSRGPDPRAPDFALPTTPAWALNPRTFDPVAPTPQWAQNPRAFELTDPRAPEQAQARIDAKSLSDINTYLSTTNQTPTNTAIFNAIISGLTPAVNPADYGKISAPLDLAPDLATQLGIQDVSATTPDTTDWGSVFEGAAPSPEPDTTDWGSVFEGAPSNQNVDWGSVFEAPMSPDAAQARIEAFIPAGRETNFEYGPTAATPSAPTNPADPWSWAMPSYDRTTESGLAGTPVADPALSGAPANAAPAPGAAPWGWALAAPGAADAAAAGAGAGEPGEPGEPGSIDPGVSPDAIANAASNAALDVAANPAAGDAASQAAQAAAEAGQSLANVTDAARDAALANGATLEQADAIAAAVYNAAVSKAENEVGTTPGAPPAAPTTPTTQTPPPSLVEMAQPDATRSESFVPGGRTTDFNYPSSAPPGPQSNLSPAVPMPQARPADAPGVPMPQSRPTDVPGFMPPANANTAVGPGLPGVVPAHTSGGQNRTTAPTAIIVHRTESGPNYGINNLKNQMQGGGAGYSYAVGRDPADPSKAVIYELRDPSRTAGHMQPNTSKGYREAFRAQGNLSNRNTIGVSFIADTDEDITPAMKEQMQGLVAALGKNNNIPPSRVYGHGQVNPGHRQAGEGRNIVNWAQAKAGSWGDTRIATLPPDVPVTRPPAEIPATLPPPDAPLPPDVPVTRPPADIPIDIPSQAPAPFMTPPARGPADPAMLARTIAGIQQGVLKGGKGEAPIGLNTTKDEAIARGSKGREALIAAGIPPAMARAAILDTANKIAHAMGYYPGGPNATVLGFSILGKVQSGIAEGVAQAMQGYHPATLPVQGPYGFQPDAPAREAEDAAPGKRSEAPSFGGFVIPVAGGRDVGAPATIEPGQPPGRAEGEAPLPGGLGANLDPSDALAPTDPRSETVYDPDRGVGRTPVFDPDILQLQQQEQQQYQQDLDPRGQRQASLLDFLQNFNPISTAEARGGGRQAGNLQAPRADPGTIQSRLSEARANVIDDLQTNQGLRNTLDLIVTGEVGSQGKAAVLGFLETAMNKVAAEASAQGRAPTGRDLLNYLNNRSYFPDTWGKIESGKIKGGALTDDLLGAIAAGSNTTKGSTGNSSATSPGSRFGGNPTNATIGREHYGVENYAHHAAWYNALGAPPAGRGIGSDYAVGPYDAPAVAAQPPEAPLRGLAKGGRVDDDEPVVVGEEGPEVFVPDQPGTVFPHIPQSGKPGNIDRWPKVPAPEYPGRYGGLEREIRRQTREAQYAVPTLMDMIDSGRLRLNAANWHAMLNDPALIALGRSRMDDRREGIDPGAEQYGTEQPGAVLPIGTYIPTPAPAADPTNPMAQALGYGSIKRRPMQIGRQSYQ